MKKVLPLEYISKLDSTIPKDFSDRACGVICIAMILRTEKKNFGTIDNLIKQGRSLEAYIEGVGWRHLGLLRLLSEYDIDSRLREYKKVGEDYEKSFTQNITKNKKIIVSVSAGFGKNNSSHLIVVHGFETDEHGEVILWLVNDSSSESFREEWVGAEYFKNYFRRLAIIVG